MLLQMTPVASSSLAAVGYDPGTAELRIQFRSGSLYAYYAVPARRYQDLMNAESKGRYFRDHISSQYPYKQLF